MQPDDMKDLSADDIAARLNRDRANLAGSIEGLRERLSVDALLTDAVEYAKANVTPYARALDGAVRANPLAAVMAGVGIAWLAFGRKSSSSDAEKPLAGTKYEALSRWEDEGGPVSSLPDPEHSWMAEADALRDKASGALAKIDSMARAGLHNAADIAAERARVLADLARTTRATMMRGLESLTTDAQGQALSAREAAYAARNAAVRRGSKLIEDQPVVAGAIGMAIGAAVAAALPRTAMEDRLFGEDRDELVRRASDALRHERQKATGAVTRLADAVAGEVQDGARNLVNEVI